VKHAPDLHLRAADPERDAAAMLAIFNHEIEHSTALYEEEPRTLDTMTAWFSSKAAGDWPVLVAEDLQGTLLGFASYGPFRAYPSFRYTVEHSVYVALAARRRGVARALLRALVQQARKESIHVMIGAIDAENHASLALHAALGFEPVGHLKQTGRKFGRWLDLVLVQRLLDGGPK
jgi:phosphinothricin acetyltransferase